MLIAFSLYGDQECYYHGAVENVHLAKLWYPDATCRFYVDKKAPPALVAPVLRADAEIAWMDNAGNGMMWRFLAAAEPGVVLVRDADSRIGFREKEAVEDWLATDRDFHTMHDHPYHQAPIMGGMWGCRNGILASPEFCPAVLSSKFLSYGDDQKFLAEYVWPRVRHRAVRHGAERPWPTDRTEDYVGRAFRW